MRSSSACRWRHPPLLDAAALNACAGPATLDLTTTTPKSLAGATVGWGCGDTPFGPGVIAWIDDRVCGLGFPVGGRDAPATVQRVARAIADVRLRQDQRMAERLLRDAAEGRIPGLLLAGTPWRLAVWRSLLAIPCGRVASYNAVADYVGRPNGARAVGGAVGANPVSWLIPCHRVVAADGGLGGFGWGGPQKQRMLRVEGALTA